MPKKYPSIDYTSRDYNSIRDDLVDYAKRYYPDTFQDFSQPSFGSLMLDTVAYVGDILSFYLDYQTNESFLATAVEYKNVTKLAEQMGYKWRASTPAAGMLTLYAQIPVESTTVGPDSNYMPVIKKGSTFMSTNLSMFTLVEDVDFSKSTNEIVVAQVDPSTGAPLQYAVKAQGQVISGELGVEDISIGSYEPFLRVSLPLANITEIVSVFDSQGNTYYEVDYLTQNVINVPVTNLDANSETTPSILKPISVARRFVTQTTPDGTFLQFGFGSDENPVALADPSEVILQLHGKDYVSDTSFDPSVLSQTDQLGVVPSNTILTVVYRFSNNTSVSAATNTITKVGSVEFTFKNQQTLTASKMNGVKNSLAATNEEPIVGNSLFPSQNEIRQRAMGAFASQYRAVTKQDYVSMIYNMPAKYGQIKKCSVSQDSESWNQRNINIHVMSIDTVGNLIPCNSTLKSNLKKWINNYKMLNDTIDIIDAKIVNLGIDFVIKTFPNSSNTTAIEAGVTAISSYVSRSYDIGEPFVITDLYSILKSIPEVLDVISVNVYTKAGGNYADAPFDALDHKSADGTFIKAPSDCIFEVKFPNLDVAGAVK